MEPHEIVIPVFFFITIAAVWGSYILTRHKERMNMIERGMKGDEIKSLYQRQALHVNPLSSLKWGMVLTLVGVAIIIGIWLRDNYVHNDGIIAGLIAAFGGIGLVLFYFLASRKAQQ